ncbi:MAG: PQQ-binding-like beta-propeller repeat protein [Terriglobales bacterium]
MTGKQALAMLTVTALAALGGLAGAQTTSLDWTQFGGNLERTSTSDAATGITAANVGQLSYRQVSLPGTVDGTAIYLHGVTVNGARHDTLFVTGLYGKTMAVDANSGKILWVFTPPDYATIAGTRQVTNSTPVADPGRRYIYSASPDGYIQKLDVANGQALWRTSITLLPLREKMDSPLSVWHGHVIALTAGYNGDRPPYQGHVAILDASSGKLLDVWNSLCSNRTGLIQPASCPDSDSAIWGRAGAIIEPESGNIWIATGNAPWNGTTDWGDAVIELNPDATQILANYTPANTDELNDQDLDVGSTSPALLGGGLLAQGAKDSLIRVLRTADITGAEPHKGHEVQTVPTPSSAMLFTALAVWHHGGQTWMFSADAGATEAFELVNGNLVSKWKNANGGTSPLLAGGLLYVYGGREGGVHVYQPTTGAQVTELACGSGHWQSPVVVDGHIFVSEGNANRRTTTGVLDIWSVRGKDAPAPAVRH